MRRPSGSIVAGLGAALTGACLGLLLHGDPGGPARVPPPPHAACEGPAVPALVAATRQERRASEVTAVTELASPEPGRAWKPSAVRTGFEALRREYERAAPGADTRVLRALLAEPIAASDGTEDLPSTLLHFLVTRAKREVRARLLLERALAHSEPPLRADLRRRALACCASFAAPERLRAFASATLRGGDALEVASLLSGLAEHPDREAAEHAAAILGAALPRSSDPSSDPIHF